MVAAAHGPLQAAARQVEHQRGNRRHRGQRDGSVEREHLGGQYHQCDLAGLLRSAALDLSPVLSLETPRDPDDWPEATPRPVPAFSPAWVPLEARLKGLCKAACFPVLALAKDMGLPAPDIDQDEAIGRADAIALIDEVFGHMFPGLHAD